MTGDAGRWDAAECERGVRQLFGLAADLDGAYGRLSAIRADLAGWQGPAADQALPKIRAAGVRVSRLAGLVRQAADTVRSGLLGIADAARLARGAAQSAQEAAEGTALAAAVDSRIATGLATIRPPAARLPGPGQTPVEVARWWTALPPDLREQLLEREPAALGGLAGLPAEARDAANRRRLTTLTARLRDEYAVILDTAPLLPLQRVRAAVVRSMLAVAEGAERALADRRPPPRLLILDLTGVGRVAIGLGDVDRAKHVAVLVPGMGEDAVHGVGGTVERGDHLLTEAGRQSAEPTAVIAWIGYAAPGLREVPFATRAQAGGRMLAADLAALDAGRTVDGGDPPHVTLVGHSYGSTVVGAATQSGPRPADDLVLVGSPGVLAEQVRELGLPGDRVYVGEAPLDPVADLGTFGADPGDRRFGATPIRAEPAPGRPWPERLTSAHTHYFDPGSESLRNIARVVVGHGSAVTHPGEAA